MRVEEVLALIDARIAEFRRVIAETTSAIEALKSLRERGEMIVPLGGGVLVGAEWKGSVLIDVGGGIVLERPVETVIERLERRIKRAEEEIKRLEEEKRKVLEQVRKGKE